MRQSFWCGVLTLCVTTSCGSGRPVSAAELPGSYTVSSRDVSDTLEVLPGGSFRHRTWRRGRLVVSETGTWTRSAYPDGRPALEFTKIALTARGFRGDSTNPPGIWLAPLERDRRNRVTLLLNEDVGLSYVRAP